MNHHAKPSTTRFFAALILPAAFALSACRGTAADAQPEEPPLTGATIGGEFELTGSDGETVRWADFEGKYRIVYFGFAYCPDICPNDMSQLARGLKALEETDAEKVAKIQPMFVTIDPERDTPEVVGEFVSAFSDKFIGLTGTPEQVKAAADTFRVYYERGEDLDNGQYLMNHSNIAYLFGPSGEPLATLPTDLGAEAVAAEIDKWVS
ncbi:SCO family protein [Erythrobacter crassostreae]|uniref:SCO family protein n=1 Tax=Erythrobacter crassostreae TaxID=2828328 RepID=A0A9X1JKI8_9SPHN|nr:SCO family protein [Erythrobacter crassostrea]MBV7259090.1 SCO family protein [Erythrobacter crassostrea]